MWSYRAQFAAPIDGDSLYALLDLGFDVYTHQELRLLGVYAPEHYQPGGGEARQFLIDWMGQVDPTSKWPLLVTTVQAGAKLATGEHQVRTFTRYVATVVDSSHPAPRSLNDDINAYLATHPEWGKGIGG
jgi:hypothetical protein